MKVINLSYIIATRNRLPFLKITLGKLIEGLQDDEEIVIADGNSTDGAKEYIHNLFIQGKVQQFISEPDKNQAHGWNKAILMAKGLIIKKITDDDVHNYDAIRKCKDFMLQHPEMDVCISNSLECSLSNFDRVDFNSRLSWYLKWKAGNLKTFSFGDVYMLIRKSSISFIGLYDTQFKMIDWEYSLRITYLRAKIGYYTGCNSLSVFTPFNVSSTATKNLFETEGRIGKLKYQYAGDGSEISIYSHIKIFIGKLFARLKKNTAAQYVPHAEVPSEAELQRIYHGLYIKLEEHNSTIKNKEFIH